MAEVFLARHRSLAGFERNVVIKRMLPHLCDDASFLQSFINEAKLSAQLLHPNIVQIYDLGRVGEGEYFICMEYVQGHDLETILRHVRQHDAHVPIPVTIALMRDVCSGLEYAHEAKDLDGNPLGIIHRDVSPSNVIISREGLAKVVDFGIAKATAQPSVDGQQTQTGTVKGKISYLAPEILIGQQPDRRADVFACGVVLYEMLTNRNPYRGDGQLATMQRIMTLDPPPPSKERGEVSAALDLVIADALKADPDDRIATCAELRTRLEQVEEKLGMRATPSLVADFLRGLTLGEASASTTTKNAGVTSEPIEPTDNERQRTVSLLLLQAPVTVTHVTAGTTALLTPRGAVPTPLARRARLLKTMFAAALIVGCATAFGLWLTRPTASPPAPNGDVALQLVTEPAGATVLVDGILRTGSTPMHISGLRRSQELLLTLSKPGCSRLELPIALGEEPFVARTVALDCVRVPAIPKLQALPARVAKVPQSAGFGQLKLLCAPWGTIELDGTVLGDTPLQARRVSAGVHTVTCRNTTTKRSNITRKVLVPVDGAAEFRVNLDD